MLGLSYIAHARRIGVVFSLKQKFQKTFEDVCLYSEISYLLSTYNYRLKSRRFIQELFQDIKFQAVSSR